MEICNPVTDGQDINSPTLIAQLNDKLTTSGVKNAEHAISLACVISFVTIGISLLVLYMLGVRSWAGIGLFAIIAILLVTMMSSYHATRARSKVITIAYKLDVEPQIMQYKDGHNYDLDGYQRVAEQILPSNAPILKYFSVTRYEYRYKRGVIYA